MSKLHKLISDVFPWAVDDEVPALVRWVWGWSLVATYVLIALPRGTWWVHLTCTVVHVGMLIVVYFLLYSAGEWHGRRTAKSNHHAPAILVPWEDAMIVEDTAGCLRVHLLSPNTLDVPDDELVVPGARVRWRGKLPSRHLLEVDRFTTDLVSRRPWESRQ